MLALFFFCLQHTPPRPYFSDGPLVSRIFSRSCGSQIRQYRLYGSRVAFVRDSRQAERMWTEMAVWVVSTMAAKARDDRQLALATWRPGVVAADGGHLAFRRSSRGNTAATAQIYVLPLEGGEPRVVTNMPDAAANPLWSPDGETIAFSSVTERPELGSTLRYLDRRRSASPQRSSDYGGGGLSRQRRRRIWLRRPRWPAHAWTVALSAASGNLLATPKRVTSGQSPGP